MTVECRRAFEPRDICRVQWLSDPRISPDGRRVAFVLTALSEERDEYLSNVWIVDVDGGEPRRFTTGPRRDTSPRWSPDGRWLAFLSERETKKGPQLYVMPSDGGEPVRLTDLKRGVAEPAWSPDGTRLAFTSKVGGWDEPEDEEERRKSKPARVISTMKYKLNGEGFVYDRRPHVFVVAADGQGAPRQITDGDFADSGPAWSPDGSLIAFASARHDDRDYDRAADVWVVSPDGGEPRRVTPTEGPARAPCFSPDGQLIAYFGHRYPRDPGARNAHLFVVSVDGGATRCLTEDLDRNCGSSLFGGGSTPLWSPDGSAVMFTAEDRGRVPLYRVPVTGGQPEVVAGGERQIGGASIARGGTLVFAASQPTEPAEVFACAADGANERRLTDLNRGWKAEVALSHPERFRFERDGHTVDGWVMRPYGFVPGVRYPTLLNVHGGPAAQYGYGFFDEFNVYAGAGYALVYVNPRGSNGYGEAFARAVIGDWGGGDFADVMAGLDEALRRFDFLDPDRLGVMGGSYGGFMTSWAIGHTDRFTAACSERAVNNQHSMFGTSDIGFEFIEQVGGALPWDDLRAYVDRSPLAYVERIVTPLLIIHSEDDLRCPIGQAEELFVALKRLRREVTFVRFPDESHELSRSGRPRHRLERFRLILDWFGTYLPTSAGKAAV